MIIVGLKLEKVQRDFLWEGGALENKLHLVKWSTICKARWKGGLGVRSLSLLNKTLLCKWCWCYSCEREVLWKKVISGKYGEEEGGYRSSVVRDSYGVGLWKVIGKEWDLFNTRVCFAMGNWSRVKFLKDRWCSEEPLNVTFPYLFALIESKEAWVIDLWE